MNTLEQIQKEHKEIGKTIQKLIDTDKQWSATDIKGGLRVSSSTWANLTIVETGWRSDMYTLIFTKGSVTCSRFREPQDRCSIANFLNGCGYPKP